MCIRDRDEARGQLSQTIDSLVQYLDAEIDCEFSRIPLSTPLTDVLSHASDGPFGSKLKTEHYSEGGARVIRLQNVGEGFFDDGDRAYISLDYYKQLWRYQVHADDIVVAGLGDETHPVGRAALIPSILGPAIHKADCFCLRSDNRQFLNTYLVYFLNSKAGRAQILARAQGTTRLRINVANLKTILVPTPSIVDQEVAVARFNQLEDLVSELDKLQTCLANLSGRLINAFLGN